MPPTPAQGGTVTRARRALLLLGGALIAVLVVRLTIGLSPALFYGLAGGLVACLIIVGLDQLHAVERRMARSNPTPPKTNPGGDDA